MDSLVKHKFSLLPSDPLQHASQTHWLSPIRFFLGEIEVRIHCSSFLPEKEVEFLKLYYLLFSQKKNLSRQLVNIYFDIPRGEYSQPNHSIWLSHLPYRESGNRFGQWVQIVERDFVCWYCQEELTAYAIGPLPSPQSTDTFDNLLGLILPDLLLSTQTLIIHASTVIYQGLAWLFFGPSGAGKSTLAQWSQAHRQLKVMSSDQILLRLNQTESTESEGSTPQERPHHQLIAQALPYFIPEIPRNSNQWETSPLPVAGLIYLKRDPARYGFFPLTPTQLIPPLLGETISMESQITRAKTVFDLITLAVTLPDLCLGKLSYPLGVDFWPWIAEHGANTINERVCKYEQDEL